jgi:predicted dehydrogenase
MVGTGYWAEVQLRAWKQTENAEIIALCGRDDHRLYDRAKQFGISKTYINDEEMIDKEEFDFLDICVRPYNHLKLVRMGVAKGVPILCQKPLADTMEECQEIVDVCQDADIRLMVNENMRWQPWFVKLKNIIDEGIIGKPFSAIVQSAPPLTRAEGLKTHGQQFFWEMPKLIIYELGVHFIDTARYLFGDPTSIYSKTRTIAPIAGEDLAVSIIEFGANGVVMVLKNTWAAVPVPGLEVTSEPWAWNGEFWGGIVVQGTGGSAIVKPEGRLEVYHDHHSQSWQFPEDALWESLHKAQDHFIRCLESGDPFVTSGEDTLKTMAATFGAYESAETGLPVNPLDLIERIKENVQ